jgi:Family of unknown function (DUF6151)
MPLDLPLSCRCGRVRGVASEIAPSAGFRLVCYCKDCQALAHFLAHVPEKWAPVSRQGHAPTQEPDVLDAAGGTDIFQMPIGRVTLTAGTDAVRCLRLSDKGILRWYTECCRTPIGNTVGPRFPMIGLIHSFMDHAVGGHSRDEALGPPLCRIYERSAVGPLPPDAPPPASLAAFAGRAFAVLGWWWRGLNRPNPFFDAQTGAPLAAPRVLTPTERAAL